LREENSFPLLFVEKEIIPK